MRSSSADSHPPLHAMVYFQGRSIVPRPYVSGYSWSCQVPRVPLHTHGVTMRIVISEDHVSRRYPAFVAHTDSCASPQPSRCLGCTLEQWVCAGCCQPLLGGGPSRRCSAQLSLRAWTPTPAARVVHVPVASHTTAAFPPCGPGRRSTMFSTATAGRRAFSRLQSCTPVQAYKCAHHPGRSSRYDLRRLAAVVSPSERLVVRYLPTPRIGSPSASGH